MPRIILMGEPASGKTTLGKAIARSFGAAFVEAAPAIIYPIAAMAGRLPSEKTMLARLGQMANIRCPAVSRATAVAVSSRLQEAYSPDFVVRALEALDTKRPVRVTVVIAGLRGYESAEYVRRQDDFLVYLGADRSTLVDRFVSGRGYGKNQARRELQKEQHLFRTHQIRKIADFVIDTAAHDVTASANAVMMAFRARQQMCRRCVNTARNPAIKFDADGYCNICSAYRQHFDRKNLAAELKVLKGLKGTGPGKYDVMVGISGGKDSTATLTTIIQMGLRPLAFTFDTGYLPPTTRPRARQAAARLGVDYVAIDIRSYLRPIDRAAYRKTAALYDLPDTLATKQKFLAAYEKGRKHYSVKCQHALAFVRTCQLCRRMVIRAYYGEASRRGIPAIVLGINEWTNLSAAQQGGAFRVSGVRTLRPKAGDRPVRVFHLPFLLQRTSAQTQRLLAKLGWEAPRGEAFIESNSNSCQFAQSAEAKAKRLLGFHPDSTRLAREVTVGFITRRQALAALAKVHPFRYTPRQVLERAGILEKR